VATPAAAAAIPAAAGRLDKSLAKARLFLSLDVWWTAFMKNSRENLSSTRISDGKVLFVRKMPTRIDLTNLIDHITDQNQQKSEFEQPAGAEFR